MKSLLSAVKPWQRWVGYILSTVTCLALAASASMKLMQPPNVVAMFVGQFGYPQAALPVLGVVELTCTLLYALPKTRYLGAILLTAYLGGAVATHVRASEAFVAPVALGIMMWGGLYAATSGCATWSRQSDRMSHKNVIFS